MPIQATDPLDTLTNAQCAQLRDDLAALLVASGLPSPTVRNLKRRLTMGIDKAADRNDERAEREANAVENARRREHEDSIRAIRLARSARAATDYGVD